MNKCEKYVGRRCWKNWSTLGSIYIYIYIYIYIHDTLTIIPDDHLQVDEEQDRSVPGSLPADDNLPFPLLLSEWADGEGHIGGCCKFWGPPVWLPNTPKPAPVHEESLNVVIDDIATISSWTMIKKNLEGSIIRLCTRECMVIHIHVQSVIIFAITSYLNSKTRGFLSPASRRRRDLKRIAPQTDAWGPFSCAPCDSTNLNSNKVKRSRYSFSISVFFLL